MAAGGREVILEFQQIGNAVKVTAVDPATLVEVSIVGPTTASQAELENAAIRKLEFVLAKRRRASRQPGASSAT